MTDDYTSANKCDYWDHTRCQGTDYCPPRCPRFFDKEGTPIIIRQFEEDDLEDLTQMYVTLDEVNRTMGLPPIGEDSLKTWLQSLTEEGWHVLAFDDETVVGHVGVGSADAPDPEFTIFVLDEYQNRGIGTELIKHTIASAAESDHRSITLHVTTDNDQAISVYQNIGFKITEKQAMQIAMSLSLNEPIADQVQLPPAERTSFQ